MMRIVTMTSAAVTSMAVVRLPARAGTTTAAVAVAEKETEIYM
jgi:hypothetical protein